MDALAQLTIHGRAYSRHRRLARETITKMKPLALQAVKDGARPVDVADAAGITTRALWLWRREAGMDTSHNPAR